jgi:hypothetical protein
MAWPKPLFQVARSPELRKSPTKALTYAEAGTPDWKLKADGVLSILADVAGSDAKSSSAYSGGHWVRSTIDLPGQNNAAAYNVRGD